MPSLPRELRYKFINEYKLPAYDAQVLTDVKEIAGYFEAVCEHCKSFKAVSNWIMGPVKTYLNESTADGFHFPIAAQTLADLIELVEAGKISFAVASQKLLPELIKNPVLKPLELAQQLNLLQDSSEDSIMPIVEQVIREFPLKVEEYKKGKKAIITMFMGEVMKRSKGKADPKLATELLLRKLS